MRFERPKFRVQSDILFGIAGDLRLDNVEFGERLLRADAGLEPGNRGVIEFAEQRKLRGVQTERLEKIELRTKIGEWAELRGFRKSKSRAAGCRRLRLIRRRG